MNDEKDFESAVVEEGIGEEMVVEGEGKCVIKEELLEAELLKDVELIESGLNLKVDGADEVVVKEEVLAVDELSEGDEKKEVGGMVEAVVEDKGAEMQRFYLLESAENRRFSHGEEMEVEEGEVVVKDESVAKVKGVNLSEGEGRIKVGEEIKCDEDKTVAKDLVEDEGGCVHKMELDRSGEVMAEVKGEQMIEEEGDKRSEVGEVMGDEDADVEGDEKRRKCRHRVGPEYCKISSKGKDFCWRHRGMNKSKKCEENGNSQVESEKDVKYEENDGAETDSVNESGKRMKESGKKRKVGEKRKGSGLGFGGEQNDPGKGRRPRWELKPRVLTEQGDCDLDDPLARKTINRRKDPDVDSNKVTGFFCY